MNHYPNHTPDVNPLSPASARRDVEFFLDGTDDYVARTDPATSEAEWPPNPSVTLGAGRWRYIVDVLRMHPTKRAHEAADAIEQHIDADARRIASRRATP